MDQEHKIKWKFGPLWYLSSESAVSKNLLVYFGENIYYQILFEDI